MRKKSRLKKENRGGERKGRRGTAYGTLSILPLQQVRHDHQSTQGNRQTICTLESLGSWTEDIINRDQGLCGCGWSRDVYLIC